MLSFDISPLIFMLANVVLCAAQWDYIVYNESDGAFDVYLNNIYVAPDISVTPDASGRGGIHVPKTYQDMEVKIRYKSRSDKKTHTRICSNHWYWGPDGQQDSNKYYIATGSVKERSEIRDGGVVPEYVDLSQICLYQFQKHFEDEHIVESRNPQTPNAQKKKMCCEDDSFNGPNTPIKSSSSSILDTGEEEASAAGVGYVPDQQRTPTDSEEESNPVLEPNSDNNGNDIIDLSRRLKRRNQKNRVKAER